jgi:hypothetical protein
MAMFNNLFRLVAVFALCGLGSATLDAAEIRIDPSRGEAAAAVLEGKIVAGDFDNLLKFIASGHRPVQIYLASPGGNLVEAIKIGLLVRTLKLSTVVPSKALTNQNRDLIATQHNLQDPKANYMCASACFFIFVAGIHRGYDLAGPAILGIHSPTVSSNDIKRLSLAQASATADQVRTVVEKYLRSMGVPSKYVDDMYLEPSGKMQWIRSDEFEADFDGFIPELRTSVDAKCDKREERPACESKIQSELALRGYEDTPEVQSGQVPQSMMLGGISRSPPNH